MSPVCPRLGGAPSLAPSWRVTQLFFSPLTPPGRSRICPQHQFMCHSKRSPSYGLLWGRVLETVTAKGSPSSPNPVRGGSDPV